MNSEQNIETETPPVVPEQLELLGYGARYQDEMCEMLEKTQLLTNSSRQDIELLSQFTHAYHAPANTTILNEGVKERMLWFLVKGEMQVVKRGEDGVEKQLATIPSGKGIGEIAFFDDQPHSASVTTLSDATLILLTRDNFLRMAAQHPRQSMNLTWKLAQQLSQRLRQTSDVLIEYL